MRINLLCLLLMLLVFFSGCGGGAGSGTSRSEAGSVSSESDSFTSDLYSQGLTREEAEQLDAARKAYEAMSPEEQALAWEQERVWCPAFDHLDWETRIDTSLIRHVGEEEFARWADGRREKGLCTSIYDLARDFSIPYEELAELIRSNDLESLYPLERVEVRFQALNPPAAE